ncbi:hypothetical protein GH714_007064 [Hevea brasiliensis]|uniref:Uncharacterized protein n=1 Tax=Hevea brasiliensis TaxID=3981 RepID=A0A6A6LZ14_HEVBR|nr:hypothetical protein GH714_007064 [Hevea brasiliensis]
MVEAVKIRAKSGMDAFHVAAKKGHLGIVKKLLSIWPELCKFCDSSNTSPLYSAAVQDHLDVVNAILDVDVSSVRIVRKNGKTALHTAARYGLVRIVKALIDRDPGIVCIKDKKGQTALHMAVKGQSIAVVEDILLADSSILNERDKKGNTAVHIATRKSRPMIVSLLLSYTSVDVNAINNQRETAMDLADKLQYGESALEIKEALTEAGAKHARYVGQVDEAMELKRTITLVAWDTTAQKQVVSVVNKLMWAACACTCGSFLSVAFVVVGKGSSWMAITITLMGAPILVGTLASMCYFVFRQHFGVSRDSQRRIKRASGSKSFSWSVYSANISDIDDYNSDMEKIYAL